LKIIKCQKWGVTPDQHEFLRNLKDNSIEPQTVNRL
jgi:hypothetical protein